MTLSDVKAVAHVAEITEKGVSEWAAVMNCSRQPLPAKKLIKLQYTTWTSTDNSSYELKTQREIESQNWTDFWSGG